MVSVERILLAKMDCHAVLMLSQTLIAFCPL
jgi:hypothetical protein